LADPNLDGLDLIRNIRSARFHATPMPLFSRAKKIDGCGHRVKCRRG
jgi:CheY-like chemotaxis protein